MMILNTYIFLFVTYQRSFKNCGGLFKNKAAKLYISPLDLNYFDRFVIMKNVCPKRLLCNITKRLDICRLTMPLIKSIKAFKNR